MKSTEAECINSTMGDAIALEIVLKMGQGKVPEITGEQEQHLRDCPPCRKCQDVWVAKGNASFRTTIAYDIVNQAAAGERSALTRDVPGGVVFFKRSVQDPQKGMFVFARDDGAIFDPEERTLEYFENWRGE
jgi:hypothetical protein